MGITEPTSNEQRLASSKRFLQLRALKPLAFKLVRERVAALGTGCE